MLFPILQIASDTVATTSATLMDNAPVRISLWTLILKGGYIMIPIGILLLLTIFYFFERYFAIRKAAKIDDKFMLNIRDYIVNGNIEAAKMLCRNTDTPVSRMVEKGLMRLGRPIREIEAAIENEGKLEIYKMEKNLGILGLIAGIAPMFGFLGTIFGVIKIFYEISIQNNLEIDTISGGLYVKMVSSASGLLIGILAYVSHHYLSIMIDRVINRMQINAVDFIDLLVEPSEG